MHNKHWLYLGWISAAVLAVSAWNAANSNTTASPTAPPTWIGPEAESAPLWPQLLLPLLALGAGAVGHAAWRARRHQQQLRGLEADVQEGLEAQSQLLTLASLLPVGISHVEEDAEGQLLARFVNLRMAELLGVRLDDLQFDAKAGWRHIHPDDLRQANTALTQAAHSVRQGAPQVEVETLCRVQRGAHTRWLRTRSQLCLASGAAGQQGVVDIHACTEDITAARRHQKFSQDVVDGYPAPVRIRDMAGRHLLTNPAFDRMHLLRPGESLGKTDDELLPLDMQRLYRAVDERQAATGETQVFDQPVADETGSRTHQVTQFVLRDEDQQPIATCAISSDVSAQRIAQGGLLKLLDAAPLPVMITRAERVVYANRRCADLLNVHIGTNTADLYVDNSEARRLQTRMAHDGHVTAHMLKLRGPSATILDLWMTAVPTEHDGQTAILTWLEPPPAQVPGRRHTHLQAVNRAA